MELVIASLVFSSVIYFICKFFGSVIINRFNLSSLYVPSILGISVYFSVLMVVTAPLTIFHISSSLCAIVFMGILGLIGIYSLINIKHIKHYSWFLLPIIVIVTGLLLYRSSFFSLGSTSDSVFYMSMVNENAFMPSWTGLEYYTGSPIDTMMYVFQPQYDFQAYYHLFAYIIKLIAQVLPAISYAPVYIWSALSLFLLLLVDTVVSLTYLIYKKNKVTALFFFLFACVWSASSWNLLYAYIGNSWRVLFLTAMISSIYLYLKSKDNKNLFVLFVASGALVASSSSAIFINTFIIISLLLYCMMFINDRKRTLFVYGSYSITLLYGVCYFYSYNSSLWYLLIIAYLIGLLVLIGYFFINEKVRRYCAITITALVGIVLNIVFLFINSSYSIASFFSKNINEMSVNYFIFEDSTTIFINIIWMLSLVVLLVSFKTKLVKHPFVQYLCLTIFLFVNPFSSILWKQFIAGIVYYRCYEIFFNYFTYIFLAYGLSLIIEKSNIKSIKIITGVIISIAFIPSLIGNFNDNPYTFDLDKPIDPIFRIPSDELEVDIQLAQVAHNESYRVRVVSQLPFTKGIVNNISLSFGISTTRSFCKSCNVLEGPVEAPSPIFNLFFLRDYADQMIFSTPADYDGACDALFERNFKYLVLDKSQTRLDNGVYVPVYYGLRACNDVSFENDSYVLMTNRYVQ